MKDDHEFFDASQTASRAVAEELKDRMSHCSRKRNASSDVERQMVNGHVDPAVDQGDKLPRAAKRRKPTHTGQPPTSAVTTGADTDKKGTGV